MDGGGLLRRRPYVCVSNTAGAIRECSIIKKMPQMVDHGITMVLPWYYHGITTVSDTKETLSDSRVTWIG